MDSTTTSVASHLRRAVMEIMVAANETAVPTFDNRTSVANTTSTSSPPNAQTQQFDPRVFWSVSFFIVVLFAGVVGYGCYSDVSWFTNVHQRRDTDAEYQATLRAREEKRKQAKMMSPEKRRRALLASFDRHQVFMVRFQ